MITLDLDITRASRPSDYDLDVTVGGEWVASAKNFHHADEAAHEIWYRSALATYAPDPPIDIPDEGPTPTPGGPLPPEFAVSRQSLAIERAMRRCHNCFADHRTWQCPDVASRLFAAELRMVA